MYRKGNQGWLKHLDFMLLDLICLHLGFVIAYMLKNSTLRLPYARMSYGIIAVIMSMIDILVAILFDVFKDVTHRGMFMEFKQTFKQAAMSAVALTLCLFALQKGSLYSRIAMAHTYMFYPILAYFTRILYRKIRFSGKESKQSMMVVTTRSNADRLISELLKSKYVMNAVVGVTGAAIMDANVTGGKVFGVPVVTDADGLIDYVKKQWVDEVFISLPQNWPGLKKMVDCFEEMGITVHLDLEPFTGVISGRKVIEQIGGNTVVTSSINMSDGGQLFIKRVIDIIGGIVGVFIMVLLAIVVVPLQQRASRGPVFFKQERIGKNGKHFKMYKFRSMCMDADAKKAELMAKNRIADGMMFKLDWDPRIIGNVELPDGTHKTGIGEFIRKTSIDEFPQFINVLRGEMSLVGTRPPTIDEWEKYDTHHRVRMAMKPGITGMWQVSGRSEIVDFEQVVELDRSYIERWNLGLDIKILIKTVGVVLKGRGAM